jgi:cytochrome c553
MTPARFIRSMALLPALMLLALQAGAQTPVALPTSGELKAALDAPGDIARGQKAYADCQGCHRRDGSGRAALTIPRLSGQHASVILKQIMDIRSGARLNPPMKPVVEEPHHTTQAFADMAAFLQSLPVTGTLEKGPGSGMAQGQTLYARDCAGCQGRSRKASGMPEPSSGRRYRRKASVTSVPLALMNSSSIVRVLPATASSGSSS